ncbi:MAG: HEAT repeat domain-containing protein [Solirubrobacteraceae bacterium]
MLRYWCFHCYGINASASGPCQHCGHPVQGPENLSHERRLIWALRHPDGERAVLAARTLGDLRVREASPALAALIRQDRDPYLAAQALRSLVEIEGIEQLRPLLIELAGCDSFMVARIASGALGGQ